jgi:hypothetical protein
LPLPDPVILIEPQPNQKVISDSVRLVWHRADPLVEHYWVEYAPDSLFVFTCIDSMVVETTKTAVGLLKYRRLYWRVGAQNQSGRGPFSPVWSFTDPTDGVDEPVSVAHAEWMLRQNYPNPFNPMTRISYSVGRVVAPQQGSAHALSVSEGPAAKVRIAVYDLLGREVAVLVDERKQAGDFEVQFDGKELPSGMYFYRMKAGDYVQTRRLLLIR